MSHNASQGRCQWCRYRYNPFQGSEVQEDNEAHESVHCHGHTGRVAAPAPTGMPMPPTPRSPRPKMRSPSVTTAIFTSSSGQLCSTAATLP